MLDLSILTTSDKNKPLLVNFIPLISRAMQERSANLRMMRFAINALSQLVYEKSAKEEFEANEDALLESINKFISTTKKTDPQMYQLAAVLRSSLENGMDSLTVPTPVVSLPSTKKGLLCPIFVLV